MATTYRYRYNPIADFNDLFDAVFGDVFTPSNTISQSICSDNYPKGDLSFDTETESYIIEDELPGYSEDDISIEYEDGCIIVSGKAPKRPENRKYARVGRKVVDSFKTSYTVDINKYDVSKLTVTLDKGILTIVIPVKKDFLTKKSFGINGKKAKTLDLGDTDK